jgi:acetolactate synthase-1/3 small subunit
MGAANGHNKTPRRILSILVNNEFGVLSRISGLFSGRGFNIESLCVAETLDPEVSNMTIATSGDEQIIEQIIKHLRKLIPVIKVTDLTELAYVSREMVLVKVHAEGDARAEAMRLSEIFRGRIVDAAQKSLTIEVTGDDDKIQAFLDLIRPLGVKEIARTGKIAMARAQKG